MRGKCNKEKDISNLRVYFTKLGASVMMTVRHLWTYSHILGLPHIVSPVLEARELRDYLNTWVPYQGEPGFWQKKFGRHLVDELQEADTWRHRR